MPVEPKQLRRTLTVQKNLWRSPYVVEDWLIFTLQSKQIESNNPASWANKVNTDVPTLRFSCVVFPR